MKKNIFFWLLIIVSTSVYVYLQYLVLLNLRGLMQYSLDGEIVLLNKIAIQTFIYLLTIIPILILNSVIYNYYIILVKKEYQKKYISKLIQNDLGNNIENKSKYYDDLISTIKEFTSILIESKYTIIKSTLSLVSGLSIVVIVDPNILLVALTIILSCIAVIVIVVIVSMPLLTKQDIASKKNTSNILEALEGMQTIKFNKIEQILLKKYSISTNDVQRLNNKFTFRNIVGQVLINIIMTVSMVVFIVYAVVKSWEGLYHSADILFITTCFFVIVMPSVSLVSNIVPIKGGKKLKKLVDTTISNFKTHQGEEFNSNFNEIKFDDVSFAYDDENILENINIKIIKNKKYLIYGPSGAGKSTLFKVFLRKIEPKNNVLIDNIDYKIYSQKSFIKKICNLNQESFIFNDTLRNNITMYNEYTDEDIFNALKIVKLDNFANELTLDYKLEGQGTNVSGGEKTRISLAREIIRKCNLFFLDEPFANLDYNTGRLIEKDILQLENTTILTISHIIYIENLDMYDEVFYVHNKNIIQYSVSEFKKQILKL